MSIKDQRFSDVRGGSAFSSVSEGTAGGATLGLHIPTGNGLPTDDTAGPLANVSQLEDMSLNRKPLAALLDQIAEPPPNADAHATDTVALRRPRVAMLFLLIGLCGVNDSASVL